MYGQNCFKDHLYTMTSYYITLKNILILQYIFYTCRIREDRPKIEGYTEAVVPQYFLDDFKRFFRLTRSTFEIIVTNISQYPDLRPSWTGGREAIPIEKQLLVVLWYISGQETLNRIGDRFGITQASIVRCRDRIFKIFLENLKNKFITWPKENERNETIQEFMAAANFPNVIGSIDGTHIRIKAPAQHPETYVNRKGFHSVILQSVCKANMTFTHIVAGWPGSCHDARVLKNCDLWEDGPAKCADAHIIGDAAYPLRQWLLTPYRDNGHLSRQQRHFNTCLSTTRVVVERSFAALKGRFRRLQYIDTQAVRTAVDMILVCCILHNICILNADEVDDFFDEVNDHVFDEDGQILMAYNIDANRKRDHIAHNL